MKKKRITDDQVKLQTALIEVGKKVKDVDNSDLDECVESLKKAITKGDTKGERLYSIKLAAIVIKRMVQLL